MAVCRVDGGGGQRQGGGGGGGARVRFNFGLAQWKDSRVSKKLRVSLYGSFRGGKAASSRENGCNPEPDTGTPRPEEGRENTPGQVSVRSGFRGPGRGPVIAVQIGPRNGPPWRLRDGEFFGPPKCTRCVHVPAFSSLLQNEDYNIEKAALMCHCLCQALNSAPCSDCRCRGTQNGLVCCSTAVAAVAGAEELRFAVH